LFCTWLNYQKVVTGDSLAIATCPHNLQQSAPSCLATPILNFKNSFITVSCDSLACWLRQRTAAVLLASLTAFPSALQGVAKNSRDPQPHSSNNDRFGLQRASRLCASTGSAGSRQYACTWCWSSWHSQQHLAAAVQHHAGSNHSATPPTTAIMHADHHPMNMLHQAIKPRYGLQGLIIIKPY
jgi:hypothetical protein